MSDLFDNVLSNLQASAEAVGPEGAVAPEEGTDGNNLEPVLSDEELDAELAEGFEEGQESEGGDETPAEELSDDTLVKISINGKDEEVSLNELKSGYMRQSDYTRKTTELKKDLQDLSDMNSELSEKAETVDILHSRLEDDPAALIGDMLAQASGSGGSINAEDASALYIELTKYLAGEGLFNEEIMDVYGFKTAHIDAFKKNNGNRKALTSRRLTVEKDEREVSALRAEKETQSYRESATAKVEEIASTFDVPADKSGEFQARVFQTMSENGLWEISDIDRIGKIVNLEMKAEAKAAAAPEPVKQKRVPSSALKPSRSAGAAKAPAKKLSLEETILQNLANSK